MIALDKTGARAAADNLRWSLYAIRTNFQWYRSDGRWNYETVETKSRVANGTVDVAADRPAKIEAKVEWGSYRLEVESDSGALPASYRLRGRLVRRGEGARHAGSAEGLARQGRATRSATPRASTSRAASTASR